MLENKKKNFCPFEEIKNKYVILLWSKELKCKMQGCLRETQQKINCIFT